MTKRRHQNKGNSQSSLQTQSIPSTSSTTNNDSFIKELLTSPLFRNSLADMIVLCLEKLQTRLSDLTDQVSDLEELFTQNQKALNDLTSTVNELELIPKVNHISKDNTEPNLLRIQGLIDEKNPENQDICASFCQLVSNTLHIPCDASQFSAPTREEAHTNLANRAQAVCTISISNQSLYDSIYKARTLLKGTFIYLSEVLSNSDQYLFYLCRNAKKAYKIAATWTYKKKVYIRTLDETIKAITTPSDLAAL